MTSKLQVGDLVWWDHPHHSFRSGPHSIGIIISVFCSDSPAVQWGRRARLMGFDRHPFQVFWFDEQKTTRHTNKYLKRLTSS